MISRIIEVSVRVISLSLRLRLITPTSTLIFLDITNNCLLLTQCLYTKDMPEAVASGNLYLYADDTTVYCIGSTVDEACNILNNALNELRERSLNYWGGRVGIILKVRAQTFQPLSG